jgi:hypothetical protein
MMIRDLCEATDKYEAAIAMQPEANETWQPSSAEDIIARRTPRHDHQGEKIASVDKGSNFPPTMNYDEVDSMLEEIRGLNFQWKRNGKSSKIELLRKALTQTLDTNKNVARREIS